MLFPKNLHIGFGIVYAGIGACKARGPRFFFFWGGGVGVCGLGFRVQGFMHQGTKTTHILISDFGVGL